MIKKLFVWLLLCMLIGTAFAVSGQQNPPPKKPLIVSIFNLGTQLPGSGVLGVFSIPIHPGLSAGTEFLYNSNPKNQFFQTAKIGVFYHQYVQTGVQLYSEAGFRHKIWRGSAAEIRLGAGYLHAFTATEVFKLKEGVYEKKANLGRPQFMVSGAAGLSYKLPSNPDAPRFFLEYQFFGQMPFVKSYVPLAPNSVLHVGAAIPMFK